MQLGRYRRIWACDCDGESHLHPSDDGSPADLAIRAHAATIERITGHKPSTCPWRAFYHPLVRDVLGVHWAVEHGNLAAVIGSDPPNILVEALGIFRRSMMATSAEERRLKRQEDEAKRNAERAARKMGHGDY